MSTGLDYRAQYAKQVVVGDLETLSIVHGEIKRLPASDAKPDLEHISGPFGIGIPSTPYGMPEAGGLYGTGELPTKTNTRSTPKSGAKVEVGILGAGAAGLYAGLIIDSLNDERISYTVMEANNKDRKGGRLYTYKFPGGLENDYYDIGAMRFPDIPFMKPVFDLIRDPKSPIAGAKLKLNDYIKDNDNNLNFYNEVLKTDAELAADSSNVDPFDTGFKPRGTTSALTTQAIGDFKTRLKEDFATGWDYLMKHDRYSTRSWMTFGDGTKYTDREINYLETFNTATNLYDQAVSESVMDSLDFDYESGVKWYCIQGGAGLISDAMAAKLKKAPEYSKFVQSIGLVSTSPNKEATAVSVAIKDDKVLHSYDHVISTMPFSCLRLVDTTKCDFSWGFQTAMRTLHYDSSVKVAIRFSDRWWEKTPLAHDGGLSYTDRPSRTVVYPSYGRNGDTGATMIVSYTWAQDALRLGALAQGHGSEAEDRLLRILFKDLAIIHDMDFETLWKKKLDHHVFDWYADPYAGGAFALFGPGQFRSLYPEVTRPTGGRLHFAGEATSVHHAWVVGALNSAWRAVYEILEYEGLKDLAVKMVDIWGIPEEINLDHLRLQVQLGGMHKVGTKNA